MCILALIRITDLPSKGLLAADDLFFGYRGKLCAMATSGDGWGLTFALWILSGCVMAVKQPVDLCAPAQGMQLVLSMQTLYGRHRLLWQRQI